MPPGHSCSNQGPEIPSHLPEVTGSAAVRAKTKSESLRANQVFSPAQSMLISLHRHSYIISGLSSFSALSHSFSLLWPPPPDSGLDCSNLLINVLAFGLPFQPLAKPELSTALIKTSPLLKTMSPYLFKQILIFRAVVGYKEFPYTLSTHLLVTPINILHWWGTAVTIMSHYW